MALLEAFMFLNTGTDGKEYVLDVALTREDLTPVEPGGTTRIVRLVPDEKLSKLIEVLQRMQTSYRKQSKAVDAREKDTAAGIASVLGDVIRSAFTVPATASGVILKSGNRRTATGFGINEMQSA